MAAKTAWMSAMRRMMVAPDSLPAVPYASRSMLRGRRALVFGLSAVALGTGLRSHSRGALVTLPGCQQVVAAQSDERAAIPGLDRFDHLPMCLAHRLEMSGIGEAIEPNAVGPLREVVDCVGEVGISRLGEQGPMEGHIGV